MFLLPNAHGGEFPRECLDFRCVMPLIGIVWQTPARTKESRKAPKHIKLHSGRQVQSPLLAHE
jgi:hypothetical protein